MSGAGLLARVAAWQQALLAAGPLPVGTPVLLAHPGSPELVAALLAALGLGAVPVLPPAGAGPRQLLALVRAEGIRRFIVAETVGRRWGGLARAAARAAAGGARASRAGVAQLGLGVGAAGAGAPQPPGAAGAA